MLVLIKTDGKDYIEIANSEFLPFSKRHLYKISVLKILIFNQNNTDKRHIEVIKKLLIKLI